MLSQQAMPLLTYNISNSLPCYTTLQKHLKKTEGAKALKKCLLFLKYDDEWHFGSVEKSVTCFDFSPMDCQNKDAHEQYRITINILLEETRNIETPEDVGTLFLRNTNRLACQSYYEN